jgi:hypothetical protein
LLASFKANMARRVVQINGCAHDRADRPDLLSQGGVEGSNLVALTARPYLMNAQL